MRRSRLATVAATAVLTATAAWPAGAGAQDDGPDGEVVELLQGLIRANTSNPPGNEAQVAELLRDRLAPLGFEVEVIPTPVAGKAHLLARLRAQSPSHKPILLAGHADVVGVERGLWSVDPFAGVVSGGKIFGRGAMDFKGGLAAFTVAASRLARAGVALKRDIVLLAEADEEGGSYGTGWLAETGYARIDAGVSLNEGGWIFEDAGGTPRVMGISTIDKNSLSVTLDTSGNSTHSSRPLPDSALARLTRALDRIERYESPVRGIDPTARRFFETWIRAYPGPTARNLRALLDARTRGERRAATRRVTRGEYGELFSGLLRTIYVPTILSGGFRANVLPGTAQATVNIRLLPGQRPGPAIAELQRLIADPLVKITPITQPGETVPALLARFDERARQRPSGTGTELFRALVAEGRRQWPTVGVSQALFEAGTDAVPWRERGIPVYGVYPYPVSRDELADMHGNDERISIRRLEEGTDMLTRVLRAAAAR